MELWLTSCARSVFTSAHSGRLFFERVIRPFRRLKKMPRYFFHIDGECPHSDVEGEDHPDGATAWRSAVRLARDIETGFEPGHRWELQVRDGDTLVYLIEIAAHRRN
jgi:hypothetical protein